MTQTTNPVDTLVQQIYGAVKQRALSRRALAALASVHVNTLKSFGGPGWNPAFSTLHKIAGVLLGEPVVAQIASPPGGAERKHRNVCSVNSKVP